MEEDMTGMTGSAGNTNTAKPLKPLNRGFNGLLYAANC